MDQLLKFLDNAEKVVSCAALISGVGAGTAGLVLLFGYDVYEFASKCYNKFKKAVYCPAVEGKTLEKTLIKEDSYKQ
jgi:hypothetical protein